MEKENGITITQTELESQVEKIVKRIDLRRRATTVHYKRDAVESLRDKGLFKTTFILSEAELILAKKSKLCASERNVILAVVDLAAHEICKQAEDKSSQK